MDIASLGCRHWAPSVTYRLSVVNRIDFDLKLKDPWALVRLPAGAWGFLTGMPELQKPSRPDPECKMARPQGHWQRAAPSHSPRPDELACLSWSLDVQVLLPLRHREPGPGLHATPGHRPTECASWAPGLGVVGPNPSAACAPSHAEVAGPLARDSDSMLDLS